MILSDFLETIQDVNGYSHEDELFSDAMIAEMEVDIYGLQVYFPVFLLKSNSRLQADFLNIS